MSPAAQDHWDEGLHSRSGPAGGDPGHEDKVLTLHSAFPAAAAAVRLRQLISFLPLQLQGRRRY